MFSVHDKVVRKDVRLGVRVGIVQRVVGDRLTVQWLSGHVTTVNAQVVLLATTENMNKIEMKRAGK